MRKKLTDKQREAAYAKKLKNGKAHLAAIRMHILEVRFADNDPHVEHCKCGKLFDTRVNFNFKHLDTKPKKKHCVRCPLKPKFKMRKRWNKTLGEYVIDKVKIY